jgi:hypothetical protein
MNACSCNEFPLPIFFIGSFEVVIMEVWDSFNPQQHVGDEAFLRPSSKAGVKTIPISTSFYLVVSAKKTTTE